MFVLNFIEFLFIFCMKYFYLFELIIVCFKDMWLDEVVFEIIGYKLFVGLK